MSDLSHNFLPFGFVFLYKYVNCAIFSQFQLVLLALHPNKWPIRLWLDDLIRVIVIFTLFSDWQLYLEKIAEMYGMFFLCRMTFHLSCLILSIVSVDMFMMSFFSSSKFFLSGHFLAYTRLTKFVYLRPILTYQIWQFDNNWQ